MGDLGVFPGTNHVTQTITDNTFTRLASGAMQSVFGATDYAYDHKLEGIPTPTDPISGSSDDMSGSSDSTSLNDEHKKKRAVSRKRKRVEKQMNDNMKIPTQSSSTVEIPPPLPRTNKHFKNQLSPPSTQDGSTLPPTTNYQLPPTPNYQLPPTPPPPTPKQSTQEPPVPETPTPSTKAPSTQPPTPPPPIPPMYAENAAPVFNSDRMRKTAPIDTTEMLMNVGFQGLHHLGMLGLGAASVPYIGVDGSKLLYSSLRTLNSMYQTGGHANASHLAGVQGADALFDVIMKNGDVSEAGHRFRALSRGQLDSIGTIDNQIIDSFSRNLRTSNSMTTARQSQYTQYKNQFGGI